MSLKSEGNDVSGGQPTLAALARSSTVELSGTVTVYDNSVDNLKVIFMVKCEV